jgi:hypothetical protein
MIIPLTLNEEKFSGRLWSKGFLAFCDSVLSKLGARGRSCRLIVRLKNPKNKGFTKVRLQRSTSGDYWKWFIDSEPFASLFPCHSCIHYFHGRVVDKLINETCPSAIENTVWVRIENA